MRRRITTGLASAGGAAAATWVVRRGRAISAVEPELRTASMWLPLSIRGPRTLALARRLFDSPTVPLPEVRVSERTIHGEGTDEDGVRAFVYEPPARTTPGPALLWIHGGGTILGTPEADHYWLSTLARDARLLVVSVDYRLAPEHPFPAGLDDAYATLAWLHDQPSELGVDPDRIAVGGSSAGGLLAAALCQRAHDAGLAVAFQLLEFPMLDDRTALRRDDAGRGRFVWTAASNRWAWGAYLGHVPGAAEPRPYAVPSRRTDLTGLPPTWIGVGELDLFYEEDVAYADRLRAAGVPVTLHTEPRWHHCDDDETAARSALVRAWRARIAEALKDGLASPVASTGPAGPPPVVG